MTEWYLIAIVLCIGLFLSSLIFIAVFSIIKESKDDNYCKNINGGTAKYLKDVYPGTFNCCKYKTILQDGIYIEKEVCVAGKK